MRPVPVNGCTRIMNAPPGFEDECDDLQIMDHQDPIWGSRMLSAWMPSPEERLAIARGAPVCLSIVGSPECQHPVVGLYVGEWEVPPTVKEALGSAPPPKPGV